MPDGSWIRIENLKEILKIFEIQQYHPKDLRYKRFWREMRERIINGVWVPQFGRIRYVPGRLGFYGKHFLFEDWDDDQKKNRIVTFPLIRDLEWHRAYYLMECDGFSGFSNDKRYTSDKLMLKYTKGMRVSENRQKQWYKPDGTFKEFISPRENLFMLHDQENLGVPLYYNEAQNHMEFGSRGGGKSYWAAGGEVLYDLCFDNLKYYKPGDYNKTSKAVVEITAGQGGKSAEMIDKVVFGMDQLYSNPLVGAWGDAQNDPDNHQPSPFWKRMTGDSGPNNKDNPWENAKRVKIGGNWVKESGGTRMYHTVYSHNDKTGAQKSAGGRRTRVIHEEAGLNTRLVEAWGSNEGMISADGVKNASQKGIGTSGNLESINDAKMIFLNPEDYDCISFRNVDGGEERTCFFIGAHMVNMKFKDENGNTDVAAALKYEEGLQKEKEKAADPRVYINWLMNRPTKIEHMWMQGHGSILPSLEAEDRERKLMRDKLYMKKGTHIKLYWDTNAEYGVNYKLHKSAIPFYNYPFQVNRKDWDAVFTMYIHPEDLKINGKIPEDAVLIVNDPYVADDWDTGGSLGASYFIVNPKYIVNGLPGNCIAASYIGKAANGLDEYNETLLKGVRFYGRPQRNVWYESNRGSDLRSMAIKKDMRDVLCLRPQFTQGQFIYNRNVTQHGVTIGNKDSRLHTYTSLRDWLLQETTLTINGKETTKMNISRIPCIFLIRQIKQFDLEKNYDAVDAMALLPVALGESEHMDRMTSSYKKNNLSLLAKHVHKQLIRTGHAR